MVNFIEMSYIGEWFFHIFFLFSTTVMNSVREVQLHVKSAKNTCVNTLSEHSLSNPIFESWSQATWTECANQRNLCTWHGNAGCHEMSTWSMFWISFEFKACTLFGLESSSCFLAMMRESRLVSQGNFQSDYNVSWVLNFQ